MRFLIFEWKKTILRPAVGILLLIGTLLNLGNIFYRYESDSYFGDNEGWREAYWELYDDFSGEITSQKLDALEALYEPLALKVADHTYSTAVDSDSLTGVNEFSDYLLLSYYYVPDMDYFAGYAGEAAQVALEAAENAELYLSKGNYYKARENVKIYNLFHGREITEFAYTESMNRLTDYSFSAWLTLALCLLTAAGIFPIEKGTKMNVLLRTSPRGQMPTVLAKITASVSFAVLVSVWFSLTDAIGFLAAYGSLDGGTLPVYALEDFSSSILSCSLFVYMGIAAIVRVLGAVFFTLLTCLFGKLFSRALFPLLAGCLSAGICVSVANLTRYSYRPLLRVLNPGSLFSPKCLFSGTEFLNLFEEPIPVWTATVCFGAVLSFAVIIILVCTGRKGGFHGNLSL